MDVGNNAGEKLDNKEVRLIGDATSLENMFGLGAVRNVF